MIRITLIRRSSFTAQRSNRVYLCPFIPVLYLSHHINICPLFTHQTGSNKQVCLPRRGPNLPADWRRADFCRRSDSLLCCKHDAHQDTRPIKTLIYAIDGAESTRTALHPHTFPSSSVSKLWSSSQGFFFFSRCLNYSEEVAFWLAVSCCDGSICMSV